MIANYRGHGHPARVDGAAAARDRGRDPAPRRARRRDVRRRRDGAAELSRSRGEEGELALRPGWPSMFRGYLGEDERYRKCFAGGWYLTGDLARRDADGYFWFVGRGDDVIKSAGHLIGPFEVESALMEHPAVAEAGVIGKPDPVAGRGGQGVRRAAPGYEPSDELRLELIGFGRKRLGAAVAPQGDRVRPATLPHTRSGKIMRRLLQARELGLPEGDLSTLEDGHERRAPSADANSRSPLLRQMLRIRRFEERCVELYSAAKIRGFLHLYIGEEAVAVGVMQALDARRRGRRDLPRARPRARPRRDAGRRSWPRCSARSRGAAAGAAARCTCSTRRPASTAATRSSAAGLPARGRAGAGRPRCRAAARVTACFFGEGAVAEGEFHESMNLAALWQLPVLFCCENNLYAMGTALERSESETDLALKAASYEMPAWSVDGMDVVAVEEAARAGGRGGSRAAAARTSSSCGPTASGRTRCTTPSSTATRPRSSAGRSATRSRRCRDAARRERAAARRRTTRAHRGRGRRPRSTTAVAFAEAGTLEPVEDLTRFVYSEPGADDRTETRPHVRPPTARRCARRSARRCSATSASS